MKFLQKRKQNRIIPNTTKQTRHNTHKKDNNKAKITEAALANAEPKNQRAGNETCLQRAPSVDSQIWHWTKKLVG